MAGLKPPGITADECPYTIIGYNSDGYGWTPSVLNDGKIGSTYSEVMTFGYPQNYLEFKVDTDFQIYYLDGWRYRIDRSNLGISCKNKDNTYTLLNSTLPDITRYITTDGWCNLTGKLPAGTYKFTMLAECIIAEIFIDNQFQFQLHNNNRFHTYII